ncbi:MAG: hypothetical protein PVG99_01220 [Desulfobacteraceae bacterium]|jgi:hypothetical protein
MFCLKVVYEDWRNFNDYTKKVMHQWLNESCSEAVACRLRGHATLMRAEK